MKVVGETATDYFGKSLEAELARAAAEGKTDKIEALIKQGANVDTSGNKNMSPLGWAIIIKRVRLSSLIFEALSILSDKPLNSVSTLFEIAKH